MISATELALTRILYEFKGEQTAKLQAFLLNCSFVSERPIETLCRELLVQLKLTNLVDFCVFPADRVSDALLGCVVESTCVLLENKAREVVNSALGLLKVLLSAFPDTSLAQYLNTIVSCPEFLLLTFAEGILA